MTSPAHFSLSIFSVSTHGIYLSLEPEWIRPSGDSRQMVGHEKKRLVELSLINKIKIATYINSYNALYSVC